MAAIESNTHEAVGSAPYGARRSTRNAKGVRSMLRRGAAQLIRPLRAQCFNEALQIRGLKNTTGITGIDVDPQGRQNAASKLQEVLQAIRIIPAEAAYRQSVETTINHKLQASCSTLALPACEHKHSRSPLAPTFSRLTRGAFLCAMQIVNSDLPDDDVEEQLAAQLEELILLCNDELDLIPQMAGEGFGRPHNPPSWVTPLTYCVAEASLGSSSALSHRPLCMCCILHT